MRITIILALLLASVCADKDKGGWSWGAEEAEQAKKEEHVLPSVVAPQEQGRSFRATFNQGGSVAAIPASQFNEPLPLEAHTSVVATQEQPQEGVVLLGSGENNNREARFLGLSDTLCRFGLGSGCDNKIKKKGHGYAPSINSQYGVPPPQYNSYGTPSFGNNFENTYQNKPKGHHKGHKKGSGGVTDLISGFFDSYTKPKGDKGKGKKPTYLPAGSLEPAYGVPIYIAEPTYGAPPLVDYAVPKPAYNPPKPSYSHPKPTYIDHHPPQPTYGVPAPSFVDTSYSAPIINQKPKYVQTPARLGAVHTVHTHTVAPVEATKVQHLHSHTHVYHGAQVIKPGSEGYVDVAHVPSSSYSSFQKKSDDSNTGGSILAGTSFVSASSGSSFGSSGSQSSVSNFNVPLEVSSTSHIKHNVNPFDAQFPSNAGKESSSSNAFSSHTKFIANNQNSQNQHGSSHSQHGNFQNQHGNSQNQHGSFQNQHGSSHNQHGNFQNQQSSFQNQQNFQGSAFQPSASEFGFKPTLTIEDMINQNSLHQFSRTIYRTDCHCVPEQFCSAENIIRPNRDLSHIIDARNSQNAVYSNATSEEDESEGNFTRTARAFDFSSAEGDEATVINATVANVTDSPAYNDYDYDTVAPETENVTDVPEVVRRKRDTDATSNFSDVQGRQLTGTTPGINGCGSGSVCCRRPVYNTARALPVCGISNDENIHGRIKTKNQDTGRAGFGEFPWQAAILKRSGREMVYVCGGTLIDQQYIVTAAHCLKELEASDLKVRLGEWDVRDKSEFYPHVEYDVTGMYVHPEFYEGNLENDVALMRLKGRVDNTLYPHIGPVCLPQANNDFTGQVCRITGWGKDDWGSEGEFQSILKETEVPVMNKNVCQQVLRTTKLGSSYKLHEGMMCAGGEENRDACKGDGGGPLVCRSKSGEFYLAGIVSWGIGCGERGVPGVYVDVPYYVEWMNSITRS